MVVLWLVVLALALFVLFDEPPRPNGGACACGCGGT
jgi:hypothetical protein